MNKKNNSNTKNINTHISENPNSFWSNVKTISYAILIALFIRSFFVEPFNIPSGSMFPTLLEGDFLFVSKYSYGYSRYSLPFGLPVLPDRLFFEEPQRGDVIVFKLPTDKNIDYIKRLIGLPGDTIKVSAGRLFINGKLVERYKIEDFFIKDDDGSTQKFNQYMEVLPEGSEHRIIEISDYGLADNTIDFVVPEDHYFFMGDNRDNSTDSRFSQVGMVHRELLVGKARFLFFSFDIDNSFFAFWKWPDTIRWNRIFNTIE